MDREPSEESRRAAEFVRLLKQHDRQVSALIFALVPDWSDAQDLIQETSVRMWEQFGQYQPGTSFQAWACTIARYMVMAYRKRMQRSRLQFRAEVFDLIAAEVDAAEVERDRRLRALGKRLGKLDEGNRALLARCYGERIKIKDVAGQLGRSVNSVYLILSRLRKALHNCVERQLREDAP